MFLAATLALSGVCLIAAQVVSSSTNGRGPEYGALGLFVAVPLALLGVAGLLVSLGVWVGSLF